MSEFELPPVSPVAPAEQQSRGYPMAMLFVFVAAVSILLALDALALRTLPDDNEQLLSMIGASLCGGGIFGALTGAVFGMFHHRRLRGIAFGGLTGAVLFPLLVPLLSSPRIALGPLFLTTLFGCLLLIGLATGLRCNLAKGE